MTIERLAPGVIVEMRDPVIGGKKLGLVDDGGVGYFDLIGDGELPKPIQTELNPRSLGAIESWIGSVQPEGLEGYVQRWKTLSEKNLDILTLARALRWGLENESEDVELMERMGHEATERVESGRRAVAEAIAKP